VNDVLSPAEGSDVLPHHLLPTAKPDLDAWLQAHAWLIALAVTAAGLVLRITHAIPGFLNPDEAMHWEYSNQPSLMALLRANVTNAHPPLCYIIIYFWRVLGTSDFMLRLPSVLAGAAFLWMAFLWLKRVFGQTVGVIGITLLVFAPEMVYLSAEVREYSTLLFFMASALYFLELSIGERSLWKMALFSLTMVLAVLTHYSAIWFALIVAAYTLYRMIRDRSPARVAVAWVIGQAAVAAVLLWLYAMYLSKLRGGPIEQFAKDTWLWGSYFHPGKQAFVAFSVGQTVALFRYLFSSPGVGVVALAFFFASVVLLSVRGVWLGTQSEMSDDSVTSPRPRGRRELGLLLILPVLVTWLAAITGFYPYGGSRHAAWLVLFVYAGVSLFLASLARRRLSLVLLAAAVLIPLWWKTKTFPASSQYIQNKDQRRELMLGAIDYVRGAVPSGGIIYCCYQTEVLLRRYLSRDCMPPLRTPPVGFTELECGEYRLVRPDEAGWTFAPETFGDGFRRMTRAYGIERGELVCVVDAGWGENLADGLWSRFHVRYPGMQHFGSLISVFFIPAGAGPPGTGLLRRALDSLATKAAAAGWRFRSVFWPGEFLADSARRLAPQVVSYDALYRALASSEARLDDLLPALAFWVFNNPGKHPEFMAYMNDAESYMSEGCRFTLVMVDPDSVVGVYIMDAAPRVQ
jgi:hypothetical protein